MAKGITLQLSVNLQSYLGTVLRAPQNWLSQRSGRSKKILLGSGMLMASTLLTTLARVGMIALLARIYVRDEFGVWLAITSATAILATSDFGIGNALRNKLAALAARGKTCDDEAREYFLSVFYFFLVATLILSAGLLIVSRFIPLQVLFKTSDAVLQRAGADILIAVQVIFLIGIPLGIGPVMFFAYQETAWSAVSSLAYGLVGVVMVCGLALAGQSIGSTAIWYFLAGLLVNTASTAIFLHRRSWNPLRVTPRLILPRVWSLLSLSLRFAIVQISGAFIYNVATLVTCATISVAEAAEYNLVQKLYGFALGLYLSVYNPLWVGYADAVQRGDWNWCQKILRRTLALTAAVFTGMTIVFTFFGNFFLQVFAGKGYVSQPALFTLLGLWAIFYILWGCVMAFLTAVEDINIMMVLTLICAIIFMPISGILGQRFGVLGIAVSSVLVFAPLAVLGYVQSFWIVRRTRQASSIT